MEASSKLVFGQLNMLYLPLSKINAFDSWREEIGFHLVSSQEIESPCLLKLLYNELSQSRQWQNAK